MVLTAQHNTASAQCTDEHYMLLFENVFSFHSFGIFTDIEETVSKLAVAGP